MVERELSGHRIPFHEQLRDRLTARNIQYRLVHGKCISYDRREPIDPPDWAEPLEARPRRFLGMDLKALLRPALPPVNGADLIVLGDEDMPLLDYLLQGKAALLRKPKLALWRRRAGPPARNAGAVRNSVKGFWSNRAHWWFVDSEHAAKSLEERGFPSHQITLYDEAVDTKSAIRDAEDVGEAEIQAAKRQLGIVSNNVGVFLGPFYPDRRLGFAIEAANRVRRLLPDFHLIIIGGGAEEAKAREAHRQRFMHYLGPLAGREKAIYAKMAKVLVMPGKVRLDLLEGFAFGLPAVTTSAIGAEGHFGCLSPGENGVMVEDNSVETYAAAIADLLGDEARRARLARTGQDAVRKRYTVEAMADSFADGILRALG